MIGKIIIFISGFVLGLIFGTSVGRWIFEQLLNYLQGKLG